VSISKIFRIIKTAIFPANCLICNEIIAGGNFCVEDWNKLHFINKPACKICDSPFEFKVDQEMVCAICIQNKPQFDKALAVLNYDENSKILITNFKYFDQLDLAKYFSQIMFIKAKEILPEIDFIIPIPLHKLRLIKRKYNQAAFLAKNIANLSEKNAILDLLIRTKNNPPQAQLSQKDRRKNVAGIFKINEKYLPKIKGKNILIVDDVITTGSTVSACAKILKKNGANKIFVLTLAKAIVD
jgi:ComF family protein